MNLNLQGKVAFVCGSTQGIGRSAAEELALLGAEVVLIARNGQKLVEVCGTLAKNHGQEHTYLVADFSQPETLKHVLDDFLKDRPKANILINNTGGPAPGPAHKANTSEFISAFNAHLICNQLLVQALLPFMQKDQFGRIINVISTSVKQPLPNLGVSNTIRGAVANWAKTLANELGADGITVNNVLPGPTATARLDAIIKNKANKTNSSEEAAAQAMMNTVPAKRFGKPEEVGATIAFLCSPSAAYINGINVPVDGGRTACL